MNLFEMKMADAHLEGVIKWLDHYQIKRAEILAVNKMYPGDFYGLVNGQKAWYLINNGGLQRVGRLDESKIGTEDFNFVWVEENL